MSLKKTHLNAKHRELKGRMVPFAGWEMPVQYSSIIAEHKAVREKAGIFDVSHMGEILIKGGKSADFLEKLTCNHIGNQEIGQVRYNAVINQDGGLVDDITIYRVSQDEFFIVSNASNYEKVVAYFIEKNTEGVQIQNQSDSWHQIAVQGPLAEKILSKIIKEDLSDIKYYRFKDIIHEGKSIRISRNGYTGEDGFEIYSDNDSGLALWDALLATGGPEGLLPAGLGARDVLRLEAFFPLYGHELREDWTPVESGLGWIAREKEVSYPAYDKIQKQKKEGPQSRVCGILLKENGIPREGYKVFDAAGEKEIGVVLSGAHSPILKAGIASSFLPVELLEPGTPVCIESRGKMLKAEIHKGAFVKGGAGKKK